MKKLTFAHKVYLLRRSKKIFRRRLRRRKTVHKKILYREKLIAPKVLNLANGETLKFLNDIRKNADDVRCSLYIDFKNIESITPGCALVFASELNRISIIRGKKNRLKVIDFNKWNTNIKFLLRDMGMFELLNIPNIPKEFLKTEHDSDIKFFKFISGDSINGEKPIKYREVIKQVVSGVPNEKKLQIAITEAMDNSLYHGYPNDFIETSRLKEKRWWLSASLNTKNNSLNFMFFDQGIGIPKSLPKVHPKLFKKLLTLFDPDDRIIEAATIAGKSSTGKKYRGKGLPQIIDYVSSYDKNGYIQITSGKGTYKLTKNEKKIVKKSSLNEYDINGTLIEWQLEL